MGGTSLLRPRRDVGAPSLGWVTSLAVHTQPPAARVGKAWSARCGEGLGGYPERHRPRRLVRPPVHPLLEVHRYAPAVHGVVGTAHDLALARVSLSLWTDDDPKRVHRSVWASAYCQRCHRRCPPCAVAGILGRRCEARWSLARRRPSALVAPSRRQYVAAGRSDEVGGRVASCVRRSSPRRPRPRRRATGSHRPRWGVSL